MKDSDIHQLIYHSQERLSIDYFDNNRYSKWEKCCFQILDRLYKKFRRGPSGNFVSSVS